MDNRKETHTGTETYLEERKYFIGGRTGKYTTLLISIIIQYDIEFHLHSKPFHIMRMTSFAIDEKIVILQSIDVNQRNRK